MDVIVTVTLDVRINDCDHLAAFASDVVDHRFRVGEFVGIPGEVAFALVFLYITHKSVRTTLVLMITVVKERQCGMRWRSPLVCSMSSHSTS